MRDIRIGNDFTIKWSLYKNDGETRTPYEVTGAAVLKLCSAYGTREVYGWQASGNTIVWTFRGADQRHLGPYQLVYIENEGTPNMMTVDTCDAFCLVSQSCQQSDPSELLMLESDIVFAEVRMIDDELSATSKNAISNKAVTEALGKKVDAVPGKGLSTEDFTTAEKKKLQSLENYDDKEIINEIVDLAENKVDKEEGKGLSSEDFTSEEKEKLAGLKNYDDAGIREALNKKQDVIADLEDIRKGAQKGATALQEHQDISHLATKQEVEDIFPMKMVTYADLVAMRDEGRLVPGQQYRIIDFVTTVDQADAKSAGHQFDVIVTADGPSVLNEKARAAISEGDTYFTEAGANLKAWQLWYCLDNDKSRFEWADDKIRAYINDSDNNFGELIVVPMPEDEMIDGSKVLYIHNKEDGSQLYITERGSIFDEGYTVVATCLKISSGKGVIYRMIDEWQNDVPYDFKNVVYVNTEEDYAQYTFGVDRVLAADWETAKDESCNPKSTTRRNVMRIYSISFLKLNANLLLEYCSDNKFDVNCHHNILGGDSSGNIFGESCNMINLFEGLANDNKFESGCERITFGGENANNSFGEYCHDIELDYDVSRNIFGMNCGKINLSGGCNLNSFADDNVNISLGEGASFNSFGFECSDIILGEHCNNNMFGERCYETQFGDNSEYNTLGALSSVQLGVGCSYNNIGQECTLTSLGDNCVHNTIGNKSHDITMAAGSISNIIGNNCYEITMQDEVFEYNSIGDGCHNVHMTDHCKKLTIGQECYNLMLDSSCADSSIGQGSHDIEISYCWRTFILAGVSGISNYATFEDCFVCPVGDSFVEIPFGSIKTS